MAVVDGGTWVVAGALFAGPDRRLVSVSLDDWVGEQSVFDAIGLEVLAPGFAAVPVPARLPPLPFWFAPIPKSRCRILAAALTLPRSRFFSASGALLFATADGAAGALTSDGAGLLLRLDALLMTRTTSRAAFSTLIACALRLSGDETVKLSVLVGFFSSNKLALLSLDS